MKKSMHTRLYKVITDTLSDSPKNRTELVNSVCNKLGIGIAKLDAGSKNTCLRANIGTVLNEMVDSGLIMLDSNKTYYLSSTRPVIIRIERCEREIIKAISEAPQTKRTLKQRLESVFGADKTSSRKDDDIISSYLGQLIKKLQKYGTIQLLNGEYVLSESVSANLENINEILLLKSEFIAKIHSKGGEFFENYFMTLLSKYSIIQGKKILECYVTGGSDDGGIDGVMKTEDSLGFRETTLVQTKNRLEIATETDVRGFYGALYAKKGTRGIYAISSDFHPGADAFLAPLDDCIGVNGDKIFEMAIKCGYGIKKQGGNFVIDSKIL